MLADADVETQRLLEGWLTDFIGSPHEMLGRAGAVCPFVPPSRKANSLELLVHPWVRGGGVEQMCIVVEAGLERFLKTEWPTSNANLHSSIVALPDLPASDLPASDLHLIDEAHARMKVHLVEHGLLLGKAHPEGTVPAARNADLVINRSPVPLFIFRNMAIHDVLFLYTEIGWFRHFRARFADRFDDPDGIEPILIDRYRRGCELAEEAERAEAERAGVS